MKPTLLLAVAVAGALAQQAPWTQCGGINHSGATACVSGHTCTYVNDWYSQCEPVDETMATLAGARRNAAAAQGPFKWLGTNEAGAEFGTGIFPGRWGTEYIFPSTSTIDTLMSQGYNTFRIAFYMERLAENRMTNSLNAGYLRNLTQVVNHITGKGGYAVLDPHNFGRYYNNIITDVSGFQTFWRNVGSAFRDNSLVVFDTNNEYHDMDQGLVFRLNQAAIDGVRAAGATSQWIFVEGNSWSGAWTWNVTNDNLAGLKDPQGKIVYEMHQYLDTDGSGTSPNCVSSTVGVERVVGATRWLRQNGKVGILGELAGGANEQCRTAVRGLLDHLRQNNDVWSGALWWAAGPWWGSYMFNFEPPSGTGYLYYNALLKTYV